jgi:DNA-binding transcriptional LysR family regulator
VIGEPLEVRISLLATGRFISIFPASVFRFSARSPELKVLRVKQSLSHVPVGIVTLKNRALSPIAQLFINTAREVAKPLAKRK